LCYLKMRHKVNAEFKAFGLRIQTLRRKKRLSQEDLAEIAGLHRTYISSLERGQRNVSLKNIIKLAVALKISPGKMMSFK